MNKYFKFLLIPVFALILLCGCGSDVKLSKVQETFSEMKASMVIEGENNFFTNEENPNAISIKYSTQVQKAIDNANASNEVQKRYRALHYQQAILDIIYDFYNDYEEEFYRVAPSKDVDKEEIESLYDSVSELKTTLESFAHHYENFVVATKSGPSDIMAFNITSYSFYLNGVIDESFDFIHKFYDMFIKYCIEDYTLYNGTNLELYVDKAYLDIAYVVYLENIKSFNYSVGDNGICDLSSVVGSESEFNILDLLDNRKKVSTAISENVGLVTEQGKLAKSKLDLFVYYRDIFTQRLNNYLSTFRSVDMYQVNQYRFDLNGTVDYDSYLMSLSVSDRATLTMLDNFINDNFMEFVDKLNTIVA